MLALTSSTIKHKKMDQFPICNDTMTLEFVGGQPTAQFLIFQLLVANFSVHLVSDNLPHQK